MVLPVISFYKLDMKLRKLLHPFKARSRFKSKMIVQRLNEPRHQNILITEVCSFMHCLTSCKRDGIVQEEGWVDRHSILSHAGHQGL